MSIARWPSRGPTGSDDAGWERAVGRAPSRRKVDLAIEVQARKPTVRRSVVGLGVGTRSNLSIECRVRALLVTAERREERAMYWGPDSGRLPARLPRRRFWAPSRTPWTLWRSCERYANASSIVGHGGSDRRQPLRCREGRDQRNGAAARARVAPLRHPGHQARLALRRHFLPSPSRQLDDAPLREGQQARCVETQEAGEDFGCVFAQTGRSGEHIPRGSR